jgi:NTP pyrophosphatase (non-canonical NTP hydrolase)
MEWNEYRELSEKTLSTEFHCGKQVENLLHGVIGVITELEELLDWNDEVNKKEEVADIFWYIALLDRELDLNLDIPNEKSGLLQLKNEVLIIQSFKTSSVMLDILKKKIYYNKNIDLSKFSDLTQNLFDGMCTFCNYNQIDIQEILDTNIQKLKARYGEKFTSEKAINRNLETERKILENEKVN